MLSSIALLLCLQLLCTEISLLACCNTANSAAALDNFVLKEFFFHFVTWQTKYHTRDYVAQKRTQISYQSFWQQETKRWQSNRSWKHLNRFATLLLCSFNLIVSILIISIRIISITLICSSSSLWALHEFCKWGFTSRRKFKIFDFYSLALPNLPSLSSIFLALAFSALVNKKTCQK